MFNSATHRSQVDVCAGVQQDLHRAKVSSLGGEEQWTDPIFLRATRAEGQQAQAHAYSTAAGGQVGSQGTQSMAAGGSIGGGGRERELVRTGQTSQKTQLHW